MTRSSTGKRGTRQTHVAGEKVFVDFAGDTAELIDAETGEFRAVKLFVAASRRRRASVTTGASNYTYAEAVASEGLEDWIGEHVRMFAFLGGVPKVVVPDNLKSAVFKADRRHEGRLAEYLRASCRWPRAKRAWPSFRLRPRGRRTTHSCA